MSLDRESAAPLVPKLAQGGIVINTTGALEAAAFADPRGHGAPPAAGAAGMQIAMMPMLRDDSDAARVAAAIRAEVYAPLRAPFRI